MLFRAKTHLSLGQSKVPKSSDDVIRVDHHAGGEEVKLQWFDKRMCQIRTAGQPVEARTRVDVVGVAPLCGSQAMQSESEGEASGVKDGSEREPEAG